MPPSPQPGHRHRGVESRPPTSARAGRIPSAWRPGQGRPGPRRVSAKRSRSAVRTSPTRRWFESIHGGDVCTSRPRSATAPDRRHGRARHRALDVGSRSAPTRFDRSVRPPVRPAVSGAVRVSPHRRPHGYFPPIQLPDQQGQPHRTVGPRMAASARRSVHPGPPGHLGRRAPGALPLHRPSCGAPRRRPRARPERGRPGAGRRRRACGHRRRGRPRRDAAGASRAAGGGHPARRQRAVARPPLVRRPHRHGVGPHPHLPAGAAAAPHRREPPPRRRVPRLRPSIPPPGRR